MSRKLNRLRRRRQVDLDEFASLRRALATKDKIISRLVAEIKARAANERNQLGPIIEDRTTMTRRVFAFRYNVDIATIEFSASRVRHKIERDADREYAILTMSERIAFDILNNVRRVLRGEEVPPRDFSREMSFQ